MDWWVLPSVLVAGAMGYRLGRALPSPSSTSSAPAQVPAAVPPARKVLDPDDSPPPPVSAPRAPSLAAPATPREELLRLATDLREAFGVVAHPNDLAMLSGYQRCVELLAAPTFALDDLFGYLVGDSPALSCAAAEALGRRAELHGREHELVPRLEGISVYARHFLLPTIARSAEPRTALSVLLVGDGSWGSAMGTDLLRSYLAQYLQAAVVEADEGRTALLACPQGQKDWMQTLLLPLASPGPLAAMALLRGRPGGNLDLGALQGVARVLQPEDVAGPRLSTPTQTQALQDLRQALRREPPRSLLLVGELGVGKTAVVQEFVDGLLADGYVVFRASAAQLLAGQSYVGQLEQRVQDLVRAVGKQPKVLWLVPDLAEFLSAGRTMQSRTGLLDLLLPHLLAGEVRVLAPLQPQALEQLLRQAPELRTAATTVRLAESTVDDTLALGRAWVERHARDGVRLCDDELLVELYQRAQQHLAHEARPGSLLRVLRLLDEHVVSGAGSTASGGIAGHAPAAARTANLDDVVGLLSRLSGLPTAVLDDRSGLDLAALRKAFTARVLGQPEAIDVLVERIAMLKAGLCDPRRPIGVFLFTGPTGTGKTELCRAVAEYLFGGEDRMLRLDMSEFQHPESIGRLLGDADDVHGRQALVHRIREQPFSVVLLDEIEKAHPMVFDLFLQVFDEGRLTDRRGRVADFRHALVIATSNLGVRTLEGTGLGFGDRTPDLQQALEEVFRREFLNRIDRVVVFRSLDPATLREVLHKELDLVLQRRGLRQRPWAVEWDESALQFLLQQGWSPTLGARPLRRAIERHVLAPLAAAIVTQRTPEGDQFLFVRSDGRAVQVEFVDPDSAPVPARVATSAVEPASLRALAREALGNRDELHAVRTELLDLKQHVGDAPWAARKAGLYAAMGGADFWTSNARHAVLGQAELMSRIEDAVASAVERADEWNGRPGDVGADPLRKLAAKAFLLQLAVDALERGEAQDAYLGIAPVHDPHGDEATTVAFARELVGMYRAWAERRGMEWRLLGDGGAVVVAVSGFAAWSLLSLEAGLHVLESADERVRPSRVRTAVVPQPSQPASGAAELQLAKECLKPAQAATPSIVRRYRRGPSPEVRDRVRGWRTGKWDKVLGGEFDVME